MIVLVSLVTVVLATYLPDFVTFALALMPLVGVTFVPLVVAIFGQSRGYDRSMTISLVAGIAIFAYLFFNPTENYLWNIMPVVVTAAFYAVLHWWQKVTG